MLVEEIDALVARVGVNPIWGYAHCLRVHALAEDLAKAERLSYDAEILRAAASCTTWAYIKPTRSAMPRTTPGARRTSPNASSRTGTSPRRPPARSSMP